MDETIQMMTRPFLEALRFLTVIPVPGPSAANQKTIARSLVAFPLVGLVVGAIGASAGYAAHVSFVRRADG